MSIIILKSEVCPRDLEVGADRLFVSSGEIAVCVVWGLLYGAMIISALFT